MIPYPAYKSTNLPWLPKIPEHWSRLRYKDILVPKDIRVGKDTSYTLLSLTKQGVIIRDISEGKGKFPKDFDTYKVVAKNDFILCLFDVDETPRTVGVANDNGMITGAYDIFTVRRCNLRWLYYHFLSLDDRKSLKSLYRGLRKTIPLPSLLSSHVYLPPVAEQEQIVRYLDSMTAKINKLIRAKKKQIALLQEQRHAIINKAVTKGLDPNVEMKDSGINWIGEIPTSWGTCRCKYLFRETNNRSVSGQEEHLSMSQKYGLIPDSRLDGHHLLSESYEGGKICQKDDLVLNRLKAHLGVFALAPQKGVVSPDYTIFHVRKDTIEPLFAEYVLKSQKCRPELKLRVRGIVEGFWRLYTDDFYNITLPLPPLAVQKELLDAIEKQTESINKTISLFEEEISTLKEYHDICVSSVVTGQTDVRNIPVEDVIPDDLIPDDDSHSEIEEEPSYEESEE